MSNFQFKIEDRSTTFDEKDVWADVRWRQKYANVWYAHAMYEVALEQ
jgi:hypothetical protein